MRDISFDDPEYFDFLLKKFAQDPKLGVAGTPFREGTVQYDYRFSRKEHVSGACQLFRRECFESIGGYVPLKAGAIDLTAVVTARMKGWKTETFTDKFCVHHRRMGTAKAPHFNGNIQKRVWRLPDGGTPGLATIPLGLSDEQETHYFWGSYSFGGIFVGNADACSQAGFDGICTFQKKRTDAMVERVF